LDEGRASSPTDLRPSPAPPPYQKKCRVFLSTIKGRELGTRIMSEIQALRRGLINEFRAIVYPAPWHESALTSLGLKTRESS